MTQQYRIFETLVERVMAFGNQRAGGSVSRINLTEVLKSTLPWGQREHAILLSLVEKNGKADFTPSPK